MLSTDFRGEQCPSGNGARQRGLAERQARPWSPLSRRRKSEAGGGVAGRPANSGAAETSPDEAALRSRLDRVSRQTGAAAPQDFLGEGEVLSRAQPLLDALTSIPQYSH